MEMGHYVARNKRRRVYDLSYKVYRVIRVQYNKRVISKQNRFYSICLVETEGEAAMGSFSIMEQNERGSNTGTCMAT